jgi:predicted secreted protein
MWSPEFLRAVLPDRITNQVRDATNQVRIATDTLRAMDRRLARRNLRTALITSVIGLLMFALTFVAALLYVA